ncbi:conserved hypothetical protein [Myxococcus xanthus DK 1622]|uniref:Uncharacterized protein n=1 Tax=Myxococcus xanthus (strain DK1622) TaxID=246197 RepID=Q1CY61_MYXXD|nr:conserved hypothetical protein [Myxococcus xanthus DK 1622]
MPRGGGHRHALTARTRASRGPRFRAGARRQPATNMARCRAGRMRAVAPAPKRRKSSSTPSLKMTPSDAIRDSSTSSRSSVTSPITRLAPE